MLEMVAKKAPEYRWKALAEVVWAGLIGASVYALTFLAEFNVDHLAEWRTVLPAIGAGILRAGAGAALAVLTARRS